MIQLTDNLFVRADERNYIVDKPRGKASKGSLLLSPSYFSLPCRGLCPALFLRLLKSRSQTIRLQPYVSLRKNRNADKLILSRN